MRLVYSCCFPLKTLLLREPIFCQLPAMTGLQVCSAGWISKQIYIYMYISAFVYKNSQCCVNISLATFDTKALKNKTAVWLEI